MESVKTRVYKPGFKFDWSSWPWTIPLLETFDDQLKVYDPDPPEGVMFIAPSFAPLQLIWKVFVVGIFSLSSKSSGSSITYCAVSVQLLASVTVTLYVPGPKLVWSSASTSKPLPPFVVHENVYGAVPPWIVKLIEASFSPLHDISNPLLSDTIEFITKSSGCVTVKDLLMVHSFASVTTTV